MPNDPTTDNPIHPLDVDRGDWELAFKPYEENPHDALSLGFNLAELRTHLDSLLIKPRPVMEALDRALEALFPFTDFHKASFDLFMRLMDGKLTFDEEQMLHALGIEF
jgi:hypothetical protein